LHDPSPQTHNISIGRIITAIAFFILVGLKLKSHLKTPIKIINNIKILSLPQSILKNDQLISKISETLNRFLYLEFSSVRRKPFILKFAYL
jgi:hypothetical protein